MVGEIDRQTVFEDSTSIPFNDNRTDISDSINTYFYFLLVSNEHDDGPLKCHGTT